MTQADGGAGSRRTVQVAIDEIAASPAGVSLPEIELVTEIAEGHPRGTPESVAAAFRALGDQDVIAVIGPAISDNALTCVPVTDELQLPSINWTGSEQARSEWMFHYQVGSLEDEPFVIARRLAAARAETRGARPRGLVHRPPVRVVLRRRGARQRARAPRYGRPRRVGRQRCRGGRGSRQRSRPTRSCTSGSACRRAACRSPCATARGR